MDIIMKDFKKLYQSIENTQKLPYGLAEKGSS